MLRKINKWRKRRRKKGSRLAIAEISYVCVCVCTCTTGIPLLTYAYFRRYRSATSLHQMFVFPSARLLISIVIIQKISEKRERERPRILNNKDLDRALLRPRAYPFRLTATFIKFARAHVGLPIAIARCYWKKKIETSTNCFQVLLWKFALIQGRAC